jgi:hypothetical protein
MREIIKVSPKDRASSLPRNHRAQMADWATIRHSDAAPKMNRPA